MTDSFKIIIDDRERAVIPHFENMGVLFSVERITIGDYCIIYPSGKMIIIERKTWGDLASSIKDGRMNNIKDLIRASDERGAKAIYIIEGKMSKSSQSKICGIKYTSLRSKLDHMIIRDNMTIIETADTLATAKRIVQLGINCSTLDGYTRPICGGGEVCNAVKYIKMKKPHMSYTDMTMCMLCKLPGISTLTATALLNMYSFNQIMRGLSGDELRSVKYATTGASLRSSMIQTLSCIDKIKECYPKIICVINGVSLSCSTAICDKYDVFSGNTSIDDISNVVILCGAKPRRVGNSVAKKVTDFISGVV